MTDSVDEPKAARGEPVKACFIITPIGDEDSDVRRSAQGVIDSAIKPVLKELGYKVLVAHEMFKVGSITTQVIEQILEAKMVVANLTGLNPNVMYELAVRHAKREPVVAIVEKGTRLPFDLAEERTLFYTNDMYGVAELMPRLRLTIQEAEKDTAPDNPIYRTVEGLVMKDVAQTDGQRFIIDKLIQMESRLEELSNKNSSLEYGQTPRPRSAAKGAPFKDTDEVHFYISADEINTNSEHPRVFVEDIMALSGVRFVSNPKVSEGSWDYVVRFKDLPREDVIAHIAVMAQKHGFTAEFLPF